MKLTRLGDLATATAAEVGTQSEIEAEIKELVHRDSNFARKARVSQLDVPAVDPNVLGRISAASTEIIDDAIGQLQSMKSSLLDRQEKLRLQIRALELSTEEASGSLNVISDILGQWKQKATHISEPGE